MKSRIQGQLALFDGLETQAGIWPESPALYAAVLNLRARGMRVIKQQKQIVVVNGPDTKLLTGAEVIKLAADTTFQLGCQPGDRK